MQQADPARLHAPHVGDGDAGREERVLGEGLEGAAGERRAHDAHRRPEQDVDALGAGLGGQHLAQAARRASGFHVDPTAMPQGSDSERRPMRLSPRTPDGPSDTLRAGMPRRSTGGRYHMLAPAVREAFSSRVMAPTRRSISAPPRPRRPGRPLRHHVSTKGRRRAPPARSPSRAVPPRRARARSGARVAAGSITSSISKCSATCSAFPCS